MSVDAVNPGLLRLAEDIEADRVRKIGELQAAYDGEAPAALPAPTDGAPDDNVRLNLHRLQVDKGVSFLFGKTVEVGLSGDGDKSKAEEALDDFWERSGRMDWMRKLAKNGGITGHAWAKLIEPERRQPRAIVLDPQGCFPRFDDEDIDKLVGFTYITLAWDEGRDEVIARRQRIEPNGSTWTVIDEESRESGDRWTVIDENPWPYERIPIFGCQNRERPNEFWGDPDLTDDLLDLVASIEKVVSDIKRVVRLYGHPKVTITGGKLKSFDASIDAALQVEQPGAKIDQLQLGAELEGPIAFYRELKSAWHELARIPEIATGKVDDIGQLSGLALKILYGPLIELTETKRDAYGRLISEISTAALEVAGQTADDPVVINWPDMVPGDPVAELTLLDGAQAMGVISKETIAERLGLDWEQEQTRLAEEGEPEPDPEEEPLEDLPEPAR